MAFRILVTSPLHNLGATVAATMMTQGLTFHGDTASLTFTAADSRLPQYLNVAEVNDPTRNLAQVVELVDAKAIENDELINYAYPFEKNAYLFNTAETALDPRLQLQTMQYCYGRVATGVAICDCSEALDSEITKGLLDMSDMVVLVIDMSPKAVQYLQFWLQQPVLKERNDLFILVNRYDEAVYSLRDFTKKLGVPATRVLKLHYNPWITKCCYTGQLQTILPLAQVLDYRVASLKNDITEFTQVIASGRLLGVKKG